ELLDLGAAIVRGELAVEHRVLGIIGAGVAPTVEIYLVPIVGELERQPLIEFEHFAVRHAKLQDVRSKLSAGTDRRRPLAPSGRLTCAKRRISSSRGAGTRAAPFRIDRGNSA